VYVPAAVIRQYHSLCGEWERGENSIIDSNKYMAMETWGTAEHLSLLKDLDGGSDRYIIAFDVFFPLISSPSFLFLGYLT
jgi:hypothetical protein